MSIESENVAEKPSEQSVVHTPGPWIVSPHAKNLVATADDKMGIADVAMCGPWIAKPPQEQQDANAKLIAAAPDMFRVISRFAALGWMGETELNMWVKECREIMRKVV